MMLDATGNYKQPLTRNDLFTGGTLAVPTGRSGGGNQEPAAGADDSEGR